MRTAGARARRGAGPERGGRGRDSGRGPGAQRLKRPPAPSRPHTPPPRPGAGPASTPRGDHYITPRPAAPSPAAEGGPERSPGGRALPAPGRQGWGPERRPYLFIFRGRGGRRRARREGRPPAGAGPRRWTRRRRGRAALFGPAPSALWAGELRARRPRRASAAHRAM